MINVAFVIDTIATDTAGTQRQLLELIRRLDRERFAPSLVCLWESPWMREHPLPCPHVILGYRGFLKGNIFSVLHRLANFYKAEHVHIVQTFFEDSIFIVWLSTLLLRGRPILLSSRRDIGLGKGNQPWYHLLFGKLLPYVNRRFAAIVANSVQVKEFVARREKTPRERILVHYNGVEIPTPSTTGTVPALLTPQSGVVWFCIVASLTPIKRHDVLIRAFDLARRTPGSAQLKLLVIGEGPERARLTALAVALGTASLTHFIGAQDNVAQFLSHVHCGVLVSDREGLSNSLLEYMAHGLPVIATLVGGNPELVSEENGILVNVGDVSALATAISTVANDSGLRARMGARSLAIVQETFSWNSSMKYIEDLYTSLAQGDAPRCG